MSYTKKPLEELDLIDDFLMNAASTDPNVGEEVCRIILSVLLQRNIGRIRVISQRMFPALTPDRRGVRLDVEVEEMEECFSDFSVMNIYDIEPHREEVGENLPKKNRFYQAMIDSRRLRSGETDFNKLPNLYVLNVLDYDPFGYDYMLYTMRNSCKEVKELSYYDGLEFLYFNTKGMRQSEIC